METPAPEQNFGDQIVRASLVVMGAHGVVKVAGFLQNVALTHFYGVAGEADLFFAGYGILEKIYLIGEEAVGPAFLALFIAARKRSEKEAWGFASTVFTLQFLVLICVVGLVLAFSGGLVRLYLPHFSQEQRALAARFIGVGAVGIVGLSLGSLTYVILNGYRRFAVPALADGLVKLTLMGGIVAAAFLYPPGAEPGRGAQRLTVIAAALALAGFVKLGSHAAGLWTPLRQGLRLHMDFRSPEFRAFAILILPLLIGNLFGKFRDLYQDSLLADAQYQGALAASKLGRKLFDLPTWLLPYAVSIALFPFLAEFHARKDPRLLAEHFARACRLLLILTVPVGALLMGLADPISRLVFQSGLAQPERVSWTAFSLLGYAGCFPYMALEFLAVSAFFARERTMAPFLAGIFFSTLNVVLLYVGLVRLEWRGLDAVLGAAGAFALTRTLKTLTLFAILERQLPRPANLRPWGFGLKIAALGAVAFAAAFLGSRAVEALWPPARASGKVYWGALFAGGAGPAFLACAAALWALRIEEVRLAAGWAREKLRKRKQTRNQNG